MSFSPKEKLGTSVALKTPKELYLAQLAAIGFYICKPIDVKLLIGVLQ